MAKWKASEWTDIKELTPLQFMPYVGKLFKEVTGQDLQGLSQFTGWIGQGGVLSLESSPARPDPSHPPPLKAANA